MLVIHAQTDDPRRGRGCFRNAETSTLVRVATALVGASSGRHELCWALARGGVAFSVMTERGAMRRGRWTTEEIERENATTSNRLARDRAVGPADNVRAAAALARFANRVADAAAEARRDGRA